MSLEAIKTYYSGTCRMTSFEIFSLRERDRLALAGALAPEIAEALLKIISGIELYRNVEPHVRSAKHDADLGELQEIAGALLAVTGTQEYGS